MMTATKLTTEQFLALPEAEGVKRELIDGGVIEVGSGGPVHELLKAKLNGLLAAYFAARGRIAVFPETMYHLPEGSLQPDVSVVLSGKVDPQGRNRITIAPDIAIEVVSSESADVLQRKIEIYLANGTSAVWVAYPNHRFVDCYKKDSMTRVRAGQRLEDAALLPEFSIAVEELFANL
jgi:Uma2 family endonuclease